MLPLGSPVLQRKAGYRELLRFWLQFHAGAQLAWEGGAEVFEAGARNVATLYEYWLFFQLEALFRQRFSCEQPLHALVVNKDQVPPQLVLKRGVELRTPVAGSLVSGSGAATECGVSLQPEVHAARDQDKTGSWTRGVQPDYTISIWPAEYSPQEAEQNELMVHVHFDAKYRVERVGELLGDPADDEIFKAKQDPKKRHAPSRKYGDLLKMHAYRDAVRRTAGAYVLYPGKPGDGKLFQGFHEVLPGLGVFAIRPDKDGKPEGMSALADFLDKVIEHLANRTTARERASYHIAESYALKENPVPYGSLSCRSQISTARIIGRCRRRKRWSWWHGMRMLRSSSWRRPKTASPMCGWGGGPVHSMCIRIWQVCGVSSCEHTDGVVAPGFLNLREAGFGVFTRTQLRAELQEHAKGKGVAAWEASAGEDDEEYIYALFRTTIEPSSAGQPWRGDELMRLIGRFESDAKKQAGGERRPDVTLSPHSALARHVESPWVIFVLQTMTVRGHSG